MTRDEAERAFEEAGKRYFHAPTVDNFSAFERAGARCREFDLIPKLAGTIKPITDQNQMMRDSRVVGARPPKKSKSLSTPSADVIKSL